MANKTVKGITVEIGGDTSKLGKALQDSETKSKSLQKELKSVDNLLKFDPSNIELLNQKQEILSRTIDETTKSLNVLKEAESQVTAQFESGEIGEEQYRAFQREIVATEGKLTHYKSELDTTETALKGLSSASGKAEKSTEEMQKELEDAKQTLKDTAGAAKDLASDLGKMGAGAVAGATYAVKAASDTQSAMNSLQAQTGKTDAEMSQYKETLEDLYKGNYGESMDELADVMAKVAQYTSETDPDKIGDMTKNVVVLRDTFDMDLNETLRGVDSLMKNMGVTADEAFDLIAKGAQNGLNKSDELGDNLAEYSQLWGQAGFSAEEMFTILDNGLDNGAYNLDKVNDFVKEFTISLSDGRIEENLSGFSKETQGLFKEWKAGKKTSADVFKSVVKDLGGAKNEQKALTLASNVWSALGEDNAMKVITSLYDVNDTFSDVKGTMEDVNEVKYDDVISKLTSLGRTVKTDVVAPLGEDLIPLAEKFINYTSENLDSLVPKVVALGAVLATVFTINKVAEFVNSIGSLKTAFTALNTVIAANPVGAFAVAIGAVTAAIVALNIANDANIEKTYGLSASQKELVDSTNKAYKAYQELTKARDEANSSVETEFAYNSNLWEELQGIVDQNGKIKKGYEDRAAVITGSLSDALGVEINIVDGQIQKYGELKKSIDEVIQTKKAEALLEVNKEAYTTAIQKQSTAYSNYTKNVAEANKTKKELNDAEIASQQILDLITDGLPKTEAQMNALNNEYLNAQKVVETLNGKYDKQKKAINESQSEYLNYANTIQNYEGLMAAVASGDADKLTQAMTNLSNSFMTADNATKKMLESQLKNFKEQYATMKTAVKEGMPGVTQEQVDQMGELVNKAEGELNKLTPKAKTSGEKAGKAAADGVKSKSGDAKAAGEAVSSSAKSGLESTNTTSSGKKTGDQFGSGLSGTKESAKKDGKTVANAGKTGLESVSTTTAGKNFADGFKNGTSAEIPSVAKTARSLASNALDAIKKKLGIASPSKEAKKLGVFFDKGFAGGIDQAKGDAVNQAEIMANDTLEALQKAEDFKVKASLINDGNVSDFERSLKLKVNDIDVNNQNDVKIDELSTKLDALITAVTNNANSQIVLDTGVLVGETINQVDAALAQTYTLKARGV